MTSRADLPEKIRALLTAPANVAVHGSPGSGKSWMADRVAARLTESGHRFIRIDLSTTRSGSEVFEEVLTALGSTTAAHSESSRPLRERWRQLRAALEALDEHIVLLFDQFDRVLQFSDALEFLLFYRELVHRPEALRCTGLMLSRRSLQSIETKVSGISTLASVCYTEYLGSVDAADLGGLGTSGSQLSAEETSDCLSWSGGHATLAKYWLATRPDVNPDPSGDMERAKIAVRVLDHLSELRLLDAAAQYALGPVVDDLLFERQELELLGIVSSDGSERVSLSDQAYFRDALRHRTWSMNPWGILGQAEVRLRGTVDSILSEAYGDNWPDVVRKKNGGVARSLDAAKIKQDRDVKMFSRHAPLLSYTYPVDLWLVVQVEWALFVSVFDTYDKAHWRRVLEGLSQYRAPLAHGRPEVLGEIQRTQCRLFAEDLISQIERYETDRRFSQLGPSSA